MPSLDTFNELDNRSTHSAIRATLAENPFFLRIPEHMRREFQLYRLRGLKRYVQFGAPPLIILTISLIIITSWTTLPGSSSRDYALWLIGSSLLLAAVCIGGIGVQFSWIRERYVPFVSALSTIALTKFVAMPQVFEDKSMATVETYFCGITVIIVVLALKLSSTNSLTICYTAGVLAIALLILSGNTPNYTEVFYYHIAITNVCLFISVLREQQEIREFLQDKLIAHDSIELERLNNELTQMANYDVLSGLVNRRKFDQSLAEEWDRHARQQQSLSAIFIDLDYFKSYNDTYGHAAGDECLQKVGVAIKSCLLRPADIAARYGGEEFIVLLPGTEVAGAHDVASRILEAIDALDIRHSGSSYGHVTASIGCAAQVPEPGRPSSSLLALADQALYQAKHEGRHRICVSPLPDQIHQ